MNEILKQRIVGAIVITALAAIFVPMLFDDPVSDADSFSNELSLPQQPANNTDELLKSIPKTSREVLSRPKPAQIDLQAQTIKETIKKTNFKSFIIQVGSFSQQANANEFRNKLRRQKFSAYVDSISNKDGKLYRLRVGPELGKKIAQKTQKRLESLYKVQTLLVEE